MSTCKYITGKNVDSRPAMEDEACLREEGVMF